MDTKMLLEAVEARAKKDHEGHFWIMRFTTGYKGGFSTPDLDSGYGREEVLNSLESDTIDGMLIKMLTKEVSPEGMANCYHCDNLIPIDSTTCPKCGDNVVLCHACGNLVSNDIVATEGYFDCPACFSQVSARI